MFLLLIVILLALFSSVSPQRTRSAKPSTKPTAVPSTATAPLPTALPNSPQPSAAPVPAAPTESPTARPTIYPMILLKNGVNLQPSYYNGGVVTFGWDLMKKYPQIKTLRIEIEPDKVTQAFDWITQATANGYEIIATYHKYTVIGTDDVGELNAAANWWVANYAYLSSAGAFTINIMNEWGSHGQSPSSYSSAYNAAIATIRTVYPSELFLIVDLPGWGQDTRTAAVASFLIPDEYIILRRKKVLHSYK